jgi:hypothetical protein
MSDPLGGQTTEKLKIAISADTRGARDINRAFIVYYMYVTSFKLLSVLAWRPCTNRLFVAILAQGAPR